MDESPTDLHDGWNVSSPEAQGLDASILRGLATQFEAWPEANVHAILMARNGSLVYDLLAAIGAKVSGDTIEALTSRELWQPLGIADFDWMCYATGMANAASGLRLRPRDLAKIGQLVLGRGAWHSRQVVPASWVAESLTPQINGAGLYFYGFQWWLGRSLVARREVTWAAGVGWGLQGEVF